MHLITQTLQANKNTQFFTSTNSGNLNNKPPEQTIPYLFLKCTYPQTKCQCQAKLRPYILCIIGAHNSTQPSLVPIHALTIQLIEFTYYHDKFHDQTLTHKRNKYDPLINTLQINGWQTNPLVTITVGFRGAIHEHSITKATNLKVTKPAIKTLMKKYTRLPSNTSHISF